jgi:hypothetical protein
MRRQYEVVFFSMPVLREIILGVMICISWIALDPGKIKEEI